MPEKAALCMMLRDEAENVERAIRSVYGLFSTFVIGFDLATTDNTEDIVRRMLEGIPGYYYFFRWENSFALGRNILLDLAYERCPECKWLISLDGDDLIDPRSRDVIQAWLDNPIPPYRLLNELVYLDPDAYGIPTLFYPRAALVMNSPDLRYEGAAHNVLLCPAEQQLYLHNLICLHRQAPRKRAMREQQRIDQNIPALTAAAEADPSDARARFYRANTRFDAGDFAGSEADYLASLDVDTWPEQRYQTLIHLARLRFMAGDMLKAHEYAWRALMEPSAYNRAETYALLGDCALVDGRVGEAIHWYSITGNMRPPVSSLFLEGPVYTYWPHWRLTLLYDRLGMPVEALAHAKRAYEWHPSPDFETACRVLEAQLQAERQEPEDMAPQPMCGRVQEIVAELPQATQILPLPQVELDRLLAEIPVGVSA